MSDSTSVHVCALLHHVSTANIGVGGLSYDDASSGSKCNIWYIPLHQVCCCYSLGRPDMHMYKDLYHQSYNMCQLHTCLVLADTAVCILIGLHRIRISVCLHTLQLTIETLLGASPTAVHWHEALITTAAAAHLHVYVKIHAPKHTLHETRCCLDPSWYLKIES